MTENHYAGERRKRKAETAEAIICGTFSTRNTICHLLPYRCDYLGRDQGRNCILSEDRTCSEILCGNSSISGVLFCRVAHPSNLAMHHFLAEHPVQWYTHIW